MEEAVSIEIETENIESQKDANPSNETKINMKVSHQKNSRSPSIRKVNKQAYPLIISIGLFTTTTKIYRPWKFLRDYYLFLDCLVNTTRDIDLLCDKGIIRNYLGDNKAATSLVNKLNIHVSWSGINPNHNHIFKELNDFYKKPSHKWEATFRHQYLSTPWRIASTVAAIILRVHIHTNSIWKATLRHQYFSTPWRIASTVAAIILLVFMFIQTVCSIIQIVPIV
ncbi:upf0481 protein [Quercus suber]|uniref:Upf0481 protein n=1 Tax=Quercus suber TaxID=58331 RepID=A0AAW0KK14_QUESU